MNVESLKSELQQVLDNDVVLRKEFNELKRSLSDYRNQLIMRDEDCKRLQVTIDVLNTKLAVMERDNTNYKAELTSFKELRGSIKEQLQAKQEEIDSRLAEIQGLRDDINSMAAGYEAQIDTLKTAATAESDRLKIEHAQQLNELRTNIHYKENGLKDEFENRLSELTVNWADTEQSLQLNHEEQIISLKENHALEINSLKENYESQISNLSSDSLQTIDSLKESHQLTVSQMEEGFNHKAEVLDAIYKAEVSNLREALEEQRNTLTTNFNAQVEKLTSEFTEKEDDLVSGYEQRITELQLTSISSSSELSQSYESKISTLVADYEEKLSNTLIHSTSQNSKLNEEINRFESENGILNVRIQELTSGLDAKTEEVIVLSTQVIAFESQLKEESERVLNLNGEFELFKQNSLLSNSEQVNELNQQIATLNLSHSDYVNDLSLQIENLNTELKNISDVFETTTNSLSEIEHTLELKVKELEVAAIEIENLNSTIVSKGEEMDLFKTELQLSVKQELQSKEVEFQKLLVENSTIIGEIDLAQDRLEAQEAELNLLKTELEEVKLQSSGKVEDFKETLSVKNFEITNLEANNAALSQELIQLKQEVSELRVQLQSTSQSSELMEALQTSFDVLNSEKNSLLNEIGLMQSTISELNQSVLGLSEKIELYESEIVSLKNTSKSEEQDAFIDRLFKQIDALNDQRLVLLDEKEQMANQLLKMNDVIGVISQQVESENIDVKDLNNHRMNVILATNSDGTGDKPRMKEQINDLVREIDKCIALLSA